MTNQELRQLQLTACDVRKCVLTATHSAKSGHPGGSLSAADLFTYLYFHELRIDPKNPKWADRDRFVLSKGTPPPAVRRSGPPRLLPRGRSDHSAPYRQLPSGASQHEHCPRH